MKINTTIDLFSEYSIQQPHESFDYLRRQGPVLWSTRINGWVTTTYEAAQAVLTQPHIFSSRNSIYGDDLAEKLASEQVKLIITMDGAEHAHDRKLVTKALRLREIQEKWAARAKEIVQEQLDHVAGQDHFHVIRDLGVPLPIRVISEVLGIEYDPQKIWRIKQLTDAGACYLGHTKKDRFQPEEDRFMNGGALELPRFLFNEISNKRKNPRNDLITKLLYEGVEMENEKGEVVKETINDFRIMTYLSLVLLAGNVTTTNLIGQTMKYLAQDPDLLAEVQDNYQKKPEVLNAMIEETLRLDAPSKAVYRKIKQDVKVCGVKMKAGQQVLVGLAAAGRDPQHYDKPNQFDLYRDESPHLAFGGAGNPHFCPGAHIARMEAKIALEGILARFTDFKIPQGYNIARLDWPLFNGLQELELTYHQR